MKTLSMPFQVGWDITHQCNYRCDHCYFYPSQLSDPTRLSKEQCLDFVQELIERKVFHLSFAGGEPLLVSYLPEVIKAATQGGISVALSTNASLLTDELATSLLDAGLTSMQISLDGATETTNDKIRGKGTFAKTFRGLQIALNHGFKVLLAFVITKKNAHELSQFLEMAYDNGAYGVKIQTIIETGSFLEHAEDLRIEEKELRQILLEQWASKSKWDSKLEVMLPVIPEAAEFINGSPERYYKNSASCLGCQPGLSTVRVAANGGVRACGGFTQEPNIAGNILERSLQSIWLESQELIRWRNENSVASGEASTSCGSICGKGCRSATAPDFAKS